MEDRGVGADDLRPRIWIVWSGPGGGEWNQVRVATDPLSVVKRGSDGAACKLIRLLGVPGDGEDEGGRVMDG